MKIKTLSVDYVESGTFVGGQEDAYNFGVSNKEAYLVVREGDFDALLGAYKDLKWRMEGLEK